MAIESLDLIPRSPGITSSSPLLLFSIASCWVIHARHVAKKRIKEIIEPSRKKTCWDSFKRLFIIISSSTKYLRRKKKKSTVQKLLEVGSVRFIIVDSCGRRVGRCCGHRDCSAPFFLSFFLYRWPSFSFFLFLLLDCYVMSVCYHQVVRWVNVVQHDPTEVVVVVAVYQHLVPNGSLSLSLLVF